MLKFTLVTLLNILLSTNGLNSFILAMICLVSIRLEAEVPSSRQDEQVSVK